MGFWSKVKNAVKKVWRVVKAVVRIFIRVVMVILYRFTLGLPDLLLGFLTWPPKKLRLHVFILWDEDPGGGDPLPAITQVAQDAVDRTTRLYRDKFNVRVVPVGETMITLLTGEAPEEVLDYSCGFGTEFGIPGEFFANHILGAGPVTVFVVRSIADGVLGCSMSVLGDYVVIAREGLTDNVALAHEIGHTCGLWHSGTASNLMFHESPAGEGVKWFQKNLVRSSRHVMYL